MGKIFKRAGIKLSTLIIAIVVFGVMFSTVGATLLFGVFYERTMFNSAYVSSKQSVSQANGTVSNYISSIKNKLDNLCDEADSCDSLQSLEKVVSTAARLEDDIYCVTIYDTDGNILLTENDSGDIAKKNATYYGIAMSVKRICEAIVRDEKSILPVSGMIHGMYGVEDVVLSMPAIVGKNGIERQVPISLDEDEQKQLRKSAQILKEMAEQVL